MRKLLFFSSLLFLATACQEDEQARVKNRMKFSMESTERTSTTGRSAAKQNEETPVAIVAEVVDLTNGSYSQFQLSVYNFGGSWVSDAIELYTGQHQLTQFFVIGESGKVIFATPMEGSELAHYVNDALAIDFWINENDFTMVTPQVLAIQEGDSASSFGYVGFSFDIVDPNQDSVNVDGVKISFDASSLINPNYNTNGLDSVVVKFWPNDPSQGYFSRHLNFTSSTQGEVIINSQELSTMVDGNNYANMSVHAYYESIDDIYEITHVIEMENSRGVVFEPSLNELKFTSAGVKYIYDDYENYYSGEDSTWWNHISHLSDINGSFTMQVSNDFCFPDLYYTLGGDVVDGFYFKEIGHYWDSAYQSIETRSQQLYRENGVLLPSLLDQTSFVGMCLTEPTQLGSVYFEVQTDTGQVKGVYLVWVAEDTPYDPKYPGKSSKGKRLVPQKITNNATLSNIVRQAKWNK